jgi:GAF domain-containing protein
MSWQVHRLGRGQALRCLAPALAAAATGGGLAVRRTRELRRRADEARRWAEAAGRQTQMLQECERNLAAAALALSNGGDVQAHICEAARACARARFALLREPNSNGSLVQTASVGIDLPPLPVNPREEPSGAAHAFATRRRLVVPKASGDPRVSRRLVATSGAGSLLFEPVLRGSDAIGVLVVGWRQPADDLSGWPLSTLSLLAAEAALGIEHARLQAELEAAARSDPLTGLPNRRVWAEQVPLELARAARGGQPITVALLDSITSSVSTTSTATRRATGSSAPSPPPGAKSSATTTCSAATAARSSRCCCRTRRSRRPVRRSSSCAVPRPARRARPGWPNGMAPRT